MKTISLVALLIVSVQFTGYSQGKSQLGSAYKSEGGNTVEITLVQKHLQGDKLADFVDATVELKGAIWFDSEGISSGVEGLRRLKWAVSKGQWGNWLNITNSALVGGKAFVATEDGNTYYIFGFTGRAFRGQIIKIGSKEYEMCQMLPSVWGLKYQPLSPEMQKIVDATPADKAVKRDTTTELQLGMQYAKGDGREKDLIEAYKWLHIAAEERDSEAVWQRYSVSRGMTEEQIKVARASAAAIINSTATNNARAILAGQRK